MGLTRRRFLLTATAAALLGDLAIPWAITWAILWHLLVHDQQRGLVWPGLGLGRSLHEVDDPASIFEKQSHRPGPVHEPAAVLPLTEVRHEAAGVAVQHGAGLGLRRGMRRMRRTQERGADHGGGRKQGPDKQRRRSTERETQER